MRVAAVRRLGDFRLSVAFEGPEDGATILFGPSGAGKSATLAVVAGLAKAEPALVAIGDRVLTDTDSGRFVLPERRRIGIVHQDARLFPHLSVARNLAYGQRRAGGRDRIAADAVIDVLAIRPLLDRAPRDLSGGERQRVALGRAMLSQPDLLLLDEPLSALDAARREEVLAFILALKRRFALPMLYVTHSAEEARALGDHCVLMAAGGVTAQGMPADLLPAPTQLGEVVAPGVVLIAGQRIAVPGLDAPIGTALRLER